MVPLRDFRIAFTGDFLDVVGARSPMVISVWNAWRVSLFFAGGLITRSNAEAERSDLLVATVLAGSHAGSTSRELTDW